VKLGEAFKAMATEEVEELLAAVNGEEDEDGELAMEMRKLAPEARAHIIAGETPQIRAWRAGIAVARAGKAISASNEKKLKEADGHHDRAMKHHRAMADHHEELGQHIDAAQEHHDRMTSTLAEIGEHVRAAQEADDPEEHLKAAAKSHRAAEKHASNVADAHAKADEKHEDLGDSHQALGRSVKRAQGCVRSVLDGAQESEPDNEGDDDLEDNQAAKEQRAAQQRRARALQLRANPTV